MPRQSNSLSKWSRFSFRNLWRWILLLTAGSSLIASYSFVWKNLRTDRDQTEGEITFTSEAKAPRNIASPLGKHLALVSSQIDVLDPIPDSGEDSVTLRGSVQLLQSADGNFRYHWILPDGVVAVGGNIQGALDLQSVGRTQEVLLEVVGFSRFEKREITLQTLVDRGNQSFGSSAIVSSRPEDSMEYIAPVMREKSLGGKKKRVQRAADQISETGNF